ncbi:SRPBCC domain-containing protein [Actinoplanes solisilvae]|uniref:SRPBCC domain-containing protein n=1 Tax=Actinoplanes solisilvae TaxID=2486853 RepID=UPI000FDB7869|nr:SRPBCC domain-containing protein [Actinoplanes solisilvae]
MSLDVGAPGGASLTGGGEPWTLIFVRELRHPPAVVWEALTDPVELEQWAPFSAARDLDQPGATVLTMDDGDERVDLPAEVRVVEPPAVLEYSWGADLLRWELEAYGEGTRLTLRHTLVEPTDPASVATGWHLCVAALQRLLDGDPHGVIRGRDALDHGFAALREAYAEML